MSTENFVSETLDTSATQAAPESEVNTGAPAEQERPEWLPEKFKSAEDMARAYGELEKKLGQPKDEPKNESTEEPASETKDQSSGIDFNKYSSEVSKSGALSEESFAELEKAGIPREVVEAYVSQQVEQVSSVTSGFYESIGGEENYGKLSEWAASNVPQAELDAYNGALDSGNVEAAKAMLSKFNSAFKDATGFEGSMVSSSEGTSISNDSFQSWAQVTKAMSDPRYKSGGRNFDPAYRKSVDDKVLRSKNL